MLGADGPESINTPISYLPFMVQYSGNVRGEESLASFDLGLHFSIRGLGNDQDEFENKRFLAKANYMYLTGNAKYQQNLPEGMELVTRFSGQVADSPLISNEQFSIGGDESVRGYFETQALGDHGVFGSVELYSPPLASEWEFVNNLKALAFVDIAKSWIQKPLAGNSKGDFISGAGLGLRFQMWDYLNGMLDLGFPFSSLEPVKAGDPRVHFKIFTEF